MDKIHEFFSIQRKIFGRCPVSGELFRLSDCKVYLDKRPENDWMDLLTNEHDRLTRLEEKLDEMKELLREKAREKGRRIAQRMIGRVDTVFTPRRLNPDDAKVLFHPIDYVVFKGMKSDGGIKEVALLDRQTKSKERRALQRSIEKAVEKEKYEWLTIRVKDDGSIEEEG